MSAVARRVIDWTEQGRVPDQAIRFGVRRLCARRLETLAGSDAQIRLGVEQEFVRQMDRSPVALLTHKANDQHYEVPSEFFAEVLGPRRKYSCCYWPDPALGLEEAERLAMVETCERAGVADGMRILELGCGWGSLSLHLAREYPAARILAVSNSRTQRRHIEAEAVRVGLDNLRVVTADMNEFTTEPGFDRVISVEMFEHMRNYRLLFARIADWLKPGGRFFMHIFCHRDTPYAFVDRDESDWMSRHFFSGGIMPSDRLPLYFQDRLRLLRQWRWDGQHYERTANAWLANMDARRERIGEILATTYGRADAEIWRQRWRMFFIACAELFGYQAGQQWWVSHYLFQRR